jgi:hypothetical protein
MKIISFIILCMWLLAGLYFGIGGISRISVDEVTESIDKQKDALKKDTINIKLDGVDIENKYQLKYILEYSNLENYFPWAIQLTTFSSFLVTSMSFGLLGAMINILIQIVFSASKIEDSNYVSKPLLGLLTGIVVLGLSYIIPTLIVKGNAEIKPLSLMFLCLFCGIYSDKFYEKMSNSFDKFFSK